MSAPACQTSGGEQVTGELPWSGDDRADAKTQVFRFVAEKPHSDNLPRIVRRVFGKDTPLDSGDAAVDRRLFDNHPDLFKLIQREPRMTVEPTAKARRLFHLTTNKQDVKPTDCDGTEVDTARNVLAKRSRLSSDAQRGTLLQQLAAKRRATLQGGARGDISSGGPRA